MGQKLVKKMFVLKVELTSVKFGVLEHKLLT